jgi:hypothetical protein
MVKMKGVEALIGAALIVVISITAIVLAIQLSNPAIDRTKENLIFDEGKNNLLSIDNYIKEAIIDGNGSSRMLSMYVTDGEYFVFPENESIYFVMESKAQIVGVGVSKIEDGINITGYQSRIVMFIDYSNTDIKTKVQFGKGSWRVMIKSFGWDPYTQKNIINITV